MDYSKYENEGTSLGRLRREHFVAFTFLVLVVVFTIIIVPPWFTSEGREVPRDATRVVAINQIQNALEIEYGIVSGYPMSIPEYAPQEDPLGNPYHYEVTSNGFGYKLGACVESSGFRLVDEVSKCPKGLSSTCSMGFYCVTSSDD